MELMSAHTQWAERPADERFWTLSEMLAKADHLQSVSRESEAKAASTFYFEAVGNSGLRIKGKNGGDAGVNNFAFGQLTQLIAPSTESGRAPAASPEYLSRLPAPVVASALNHDLSRCNKQIKALWSVEGNTVARAFNGADYARIWNGEAIRTLMQLQHSGWQVPPARPSGIGDPRSRIATEADVLASNGRSSGGLSIKVGDRIAPAGLYMGQKDMFAFMVNEMRPINNGGSPMYRGFFIGNSEVGDESYWITTFLYNTVCGNHIVWGASEVKKTRVIHVGKAHDRAAEMVRVELVEYCNKSANEIEGKIERARIFEFGKTKDEVVKRLRGELIPGLGKKALEMSYDAAERFPQDGAGASPASAWGMAQGITRYSQSAPTASARIELDRAAGKVLALAK